MSDHATKYLTKQRKSRGHSQREWAHLAGVSQGTISLCETGKRALPVEAILRLIDHFGFDHRSVFGGESRESLKQVSRELWLGYEKLFDELRALSQNIVLLSDALKPHQSYLSQRITNHNQRAALDQLLDKPEWVQARRDFVTQNSLESLPEFQAASNRLSSILGTEQDAHILDLMSSVPPRVKQAIEALLESIREEVSLQSHSEGRSND